LKEFKYKFRKRIAKKRGLGQERKGYFGDKWKENGLLSHEILEKLLVKEKNHWIRNGLYGQQKEKMCPLG
jgi:hypothetical protein